MFPAWGTGAAVTTAVVATDIPGTRQAIDQSLWTDCLCQPQDEKDLANKLLALLVNEDRAMRIGKLNRQRISDKFSIDEMCNFFMSLIETNEV